MGWSLSYQPPREPETLNDLFLAVGKALYIANGFEVKLRYVLRMGKLADRYKETDDLDAWLAFMETTKDPLLGRALIELSALSIMKPADINVLKRAKDARNAIAHEGGSIGPAYSASAKAIELQFSRLRKDVSILAVGDNLVSRWVYEIDEKETAPMEIQRLYPEWVDQWIFGACKAKE